MSQNVEDSDSEGEEVIEDLNQLNISSDGDEMLSINSTMFNKSDYVFIESDKSNVQLYMKMAEFGQKIDETEDTYSKVLSEDSYIFMRNSMLEKLGSWSTKYLAPAVPVVEAAKGAKKSGGGGGKHGAASGALSKADIIKKQNSMKLLNNDIDIMRITATVGPSEVTKWHQPGSLLLYMVFWSLHIVHALKGKLKVDGKTLVVSDKTAMDCYMSLHRAVRDMRENVPLTLISDVEVMDGLLHKQLTSKISNDLLGSLVVNYPELISDTFYDTVKPKNIALYEEQANVLKMLNSSLSEDKPVLIGYQVPPSGGKTILSVSVAGLLAHKFRGKRVLYICYNTLVRKAVANACAQAALPFWIASTRVVSSVEVSAVRPSNSCLNMSRLAKRQRYMAASSSGFKNKEAAMEVMLKSAEANTVHHCPIIIADLASAIKLLELCAEDFVVYLDEPTAGAERGFNNNKITELVAKICSMLPKQAVLLSATLPDIVTELPSLAQSFVSRHGGVNNVKQAAVQMISSLRLPVGCDALDPTGRMVLPHQLADNLAEFNLVVSKMSSDPLMQRFYTPASVKGLAIAVGEKMGSAMPNDLVFQNVIPHIGDVRHATIRTYAQKLLQFVAQENREDIFNFLKTLPVTASTGPLVPCTPQNLLTSYCTDGRALAVANTRKVVVEDAVETVESLDTLVKLAMSPYEDRFPKFKQYVADYQKRLDVWTSAVASLANSKVSKRDKDAAADLLDKQIALEQSRPNFDWPLKIHGRGAGILFAELQTLSDELASLLLSGVGYYDPSTMPYSETVSVIKEATEGRLACLFASPFIVYGTNIDLTTVYIGSSYSQTATRNALYQLIGRAGRTGKSHRAKILFQDFSALKKAMIPASENIEAKIIEHHLRVSMNQ